jgi:hypothetical protein
VALARAAGWPEPLGRDGSAAMLVLLPGGGANRYNSPPLPPPLVLRECVPTGPTSVNAPERRQGPRSRGHDLHAVVRVQCPGDSRESCPELAADRPLACTATSLVPAGASAIAARGLHSANIKENVILQWAAGQVAPGLRADCHTAAGPDHRQNAQYRTTLLTHWLASKQPVKMSRPQVLGSNQRRLSRRCYRPSLLQPVHCA